MASHNGSNIFPTSTAARMQEEIKRLQQLQRLRAATAACAFPNPSGGGLLSTSNGNNCGGNGGLTTDFSGLSSMNNNVMVHQMNTMNQNSGAANASGNSFVANQGLASLLAAQQQQQKEQEETRMMLLQRQLRLNSNNGAITNSPVSAGPTMTTPMSSMTNPLPPFASSRAMASNMFSDNNSLAATMTLSQQQLLQQQQMSPQATTISSHIMANRGPLMRVGAIEPFPG